MGHLSISDLLVITGGLLALYGTCWFVIHGTAADAAAEKEAEKQRIADQTIDTLIARQCGRAAASTPAIWNEPAATPAPETLPLTCRMCAGRPRPNPICPECEGYGSPATARMVRGLKADPNTNPLELLSRLQIEIERRRSDMDHGPAAKTYEIQ